MLSKIVAIATIIVGWLAMTGFVAIYQYFLALNLPRVFGSIGTLELPYYGLMSVKETSPILPLLSLLLVTALARILVDDALAEPYKQYSYDTSSPRWEYASAFANLLSDLPETLRTVLPLVQGVIVAAAYYFGVVTGFSFGWEFWRRRTFVAKRLA